VFFTARGGLEQHNDEEFMNFIPFLCREGGSEQQNDEEFMKFMPFLCKARRFITTE
jgi:hypothetical protein